MTMEYWPWWIGAIALGAITLTFRLLLGRPLGVSGSWSRIASWKQVRQQEQSAKALNDDSQATSSALLAETLAEFGEDVVQDQGINHKSIKDDTPPPPPSVQTTPVIADVAFLLSMFVGSLFVAFTSGDFQIQLQLSELHTKLSGNSELQSLITLFIGGLMVGLGTQMASGCSSGHGLSGCSQLSIVSIKATATFFGTAVLVTIFIKMALGL